MDIAVTSVTVVKIDGVLLTTPRETFGAYFRSGSFVYDLIISLPYSWFLSASTSKFPMMLR